MAEEIKRQAKIQGLEDLVDEVVVPTEEVVEVRRGQKVNAERKFLPGYVLVKAKLTDEVYHLIKNVAEGHGLPGPGQQADAAAPGRSRSHPQSGAGGCGASEVRPSPSRSASRCAWPTVRSPRSTASVEEVDEDRSRLKVAVSIFGRATPVELEFTQVEKV